jgi:ribosomal protein L25 (general stress protein Ctc)
VVEAIEKLKDLNEISINKLQDSHKHHLNSKKSAIAIYGALQSQLNMMIKQEILNKIEHNQLEKKVIQDQYKQDVESTNREREDFINKIEQKRSKSLFGSVVAGAFQIIFCAKMHADDVFLFFKNYF